MKPVRYPIQPLFDLIGGSFDSTRRQLGISGSQANAYKLHGLIEETAERLAVRAGFHPFSVWPEMVDDVIDECTGRPRVAVIQAFVVCVECGRPLTPTPGQVDADGRHGRLAAVCRVGHFNVVTVGVEHRGTFVEHHESPVLQASERVDAVVNGSSDLSWCDDTDLTRKAAV